MNDPTKFRQDEIATMRKLIEGEHRLGFLLMGVSPCQRFRRYLVYRADGQVIERVTESVARLTNCRFTSASALSVKGDANDVIRLLNERLQCYNRIAEGYITEAKKFTDLTGQVNREVNFTWFPL